MQITTEELQVMSRLVHDLCGIVLDQTKGYLFETRLSAVAAAAGCNTFSELYCKARYDNNKPLQDKIIDAITTQETLFFRDASPFDALQFKVIPELIDEKAATAYPRRLRIWSAACSTGQEPYSIAMILCELIPDIHAWDIQILATDISDSAIRRASLGQFAEMEIKRGLKPNMLQKYFSPLGNCWKANDKLRSLIAFKRFNLHQPFIGMGPFDIILCRNVAIYFSPEGRRDLFRRLAQVLMTTGYMFVGSTESLLDLGPAFMPHQHCRASFYRPNLPKQNVTVKA